MILAIDVGNTDVTLGIFEKDSLLHIWRIQSFPNEPAMHYHAALSLQMLEGGISPQQIEMAVLSSVVPDLTGKLTEVVNALDISKIIIVSPKTARHAGITLGIDNAHEIGSDLIANAVAAHSRHHKNCVIVDFGTALTFTTVSAAGEILGVAILPGLKTAVKALFAHTAQLPEVPLVLPVSAIGKNTTDSIRAGILLGYEGLVRSLINRIRTELGGECIAVATGGLSSIIDTLKDEFIDIDKTLTLHGLRLIAEANS